MVSTCKCPQFLPRCQTGLPSIATQCLPLARFDCHQPTVHGKRLQRDQTHLFHVVKRTMEHNLVKPWFFSMEAASTRKKQQKRLITLPRNTCPVVSGKLGARPETSISAHWVTDSTCFRTGTHGEFEQARCAQRTQLPGGLCRSDVHPWHTEGASRRTSSCASRRSRQLD